MRGKRYGSIGIQALIPWKRFYINWALVGIGRISFHTNAYATVRGIKVPVEHPGLTGTVAALLIARYGELRKDGMNVAHDAVSGSVLTSGSTAFGWGKGAG